MNYLNIAASYNSLTLFNGLRELFLVALDWTRPKDPPLSLGQASILANLQSTGIKVTPKSYAVNSSSFSPKTIIDFALQNATPKTDFAIGAYVWNENAIQAILNGLKQQNFPGRIIVGGPQVSYLKKGLEGLYPQADIFIRGYAEDAMAKLLSAKHHMPEIKGVHYAGNPDKGQTADIDFEKMVSPFLTGLIKPQRFVRWETQRGCPFSCAFCQHREPNETMKRRHLKETRVIQEARWITDNPIIQDVAVLDPIFNAGKHYLSVINALSEGGYTGKLALQARAEMTTPGFLSAIEQLNTKGKVVLEFGLQTIHKDEMKVIDRPNNMRKVTKVLNETRSRNIDTEISLIFGLPKQTLSSFVESVKYCISQKVPTIHAFPLMLLRGTPLYHYKDLFGLVESNEVASKAIPRVQTDIPHVVACRGSFEVDEWRRMADIAEWLETSYNTGKEVNIPERLYKKSIFLGESGIFKLARKAAPESEPNTESDLLSSIIKV